MTINDCLNKEIFIINYPQGEDISLIKGKIININNNNEIEYSSLNNLKNLGCPIILNNLKLIGINKRNNKISKKI